MKTKTKIIVILAVILAASFVFIKPLATKYHLCMVDYYWGKIEPSGIPGLGVMNGKHADKIDMHRDALVRLGYLEHKVIPLKYIEKPSLEAHALWKELESAILTDFSIMESDTPGCPAQIFLWDPPGNIPKLEKIIAVHDSLEK